MKLIFNNQQRISEYIVDDYELYEKCGKIFIKFTCNDIASIVYIPYNYLSRIEFSFEDLCDDTDKGDI